MTFLARLASVYPNLDLSALEDYLVEDCGCGGDVKVVLLCESPHTDEVEASPRQPLVGTSGRSVAAVLQKLALRRGLENGDSIGELVGSGNGDFDWVGLMNVCPLPMQKSPYCNDLQNRFGQLLDELESIRGKTGTRAELSNLECAIKNHLMERWQRLSSCVEEVPLLIACGSTARRFRTLAGLPDEDLPRTPHPSRGQWAMALELYETMERIRGVLVDPQQPAADP